MDTLPLTHYLTHDRLKRLCARRGLVRADSLTIPANRLIWLLSHHLIELIRSREDSNVYILPVPLPAPQSEYGDFMTWDGHDWRNVHAWTVEHDPLNLICVHYPTREDWRERFVNLRCDLQRGARYDVDLTQRRAWALLQANTRSKFLSRAERNLILKLADLNSEIVYTTMEKCRDKRTPLRHSRNLNLKSKFLTAAEQDGADRLREARIGDLSGWRYTMPVLALGGD